MAESDTAGRGTWLLAAGSLLVAAAALFASFRLPFPEFEASLGADGARMLAAAAVGAAVAVAGTLRGTAARPLREAYVFAISVGGAVGVASGLKLVGGVPAAVLLAVLGAAVGVALVRLVDGRRRIANFGLAGVLLLLFIAATPAYMTSATEVDGFGGAAIWLLGDVSRAHGVGAWAVALATIGLLLAAVWGSPGARPVVSTVLLGLAIGVAGPIAFLGSLVPAFVRKTAPGVSHAQDIALNAAVGGAALMLADTVPRILIGGYAPPLNITIAFVAIPVFLWWNGRRLRHAVGADASFAFTAVGVASLVGLMAGLLFFVRVLTTFVRNAT